MVHLFATQAIVFSKVIAILTFLMLWVAQLTCFIWFVSLGYIWPSVFELCKLLFLSVRYGKERGLDRLGPLSSS